MRNDEKLQITLEQYKLYVGIADRLRDRRDRLHAYFIGLNTAAISVLALIIVSDTKYETARSLLAASLAIPFWAAINLTWFYLLRVHRSTARLKGEVIHELEVKLPKKPWTAEQSRKPKNWLDSTAIELFFPWLFAVPYLPIVLWPMFKSLFVD